MFDKKSEKNKQFLHIEIEESQEENMQKSSQGDDDMEQQNDEQQNCQQNLSSDHDQNNDEYDEDENNHGDDDDNNQESYQYQYQHNGSQNSQQNSQTDEKIYQPHSHNKYKSINDQHYLLQEQDHNISQSIYVFKEQPKNLSTIKLKNHNQSLSEQKDQEVQKIIHDVLYRRKQKQKQKQLLQSIIKSDKKNQTIHNFLNFSHKIKENSHSAVENLKQQKNLKNHYSLMKKCKQLETKITKMMKKTNSTLKVKINQTKEALIVKESCSQQVLKIKKSLKTQNTTLKSIKLKLKFGKRIKLQKSQLNSIFIMNSKSQIRQPSINQESTIKSVENPSIMSKNNKKNIMLFRILLDNHLNNLFNKFLTQYYQKGESKIKSKKPKKSQNFKQNQQRLQKESQQEHKKNKICKQRHHKKATQISPTKYKSPILQFNSYLIDESQYISPTVSKKKENIYIEDDMVPKKQQQKHSYFENESQNQFMIQQLKDLMQKYLMLQLQERNLQEKVQNNYAKIKQYETQHYHQIVDSI